MSTNTKAVYDNLFNKNKNAPPFEKIKDNWIEIKFKKRRPTEGELVLLSNDKDKWVVAGERIGEEYYNQFEYPHEPQIYPTHWKPLPKPPNPEAEL